MGRIRLAEIRWPEVAKAGSGRHLLIIAAPSTRYTEIHSGRRRATT